MKFPVHSVVVLGSVTRNPDKIEKIGYLLRKKGYLVITPRMVPFYGAKTEAEKSADREFYYNAIRNFESVIVTLPNGPATLMEIGYALALNKYIFYNDIPTDKQEDLEHRALVNSGRAIVWKVL